MRPPWPMLAALLCAAQMLTAAPGLARLEMPPGQAGAGAESGGRAIPGAGRHSKPGCAPAFLPMFAFGWWMPFMSGGCLGLQQIEMQTRLDAGARAAILSPPPATRAPRPAASLRARQIREKDRSEHRHKDGLERH